MFFPSHLGKRPNNMVNYYVPENFSYTPWTDTNKQLTNNSTNINIVVFNYYNPISKQQGLKNQYIWILFQCLEYNVHYPAI